MVRPSGTVTFLFTDIGRSTRRWETDAEAMRGAFPSDVRDRLGDRFRLLSGARRGLERQQTLRHAVQWSYELLNDDERFVLHHCSVFADGFDLAAVTAVCERFDEYTVLDLVDSLVRKSLVTGKSIEPDLPASWRGTGIRWPGGSTGSWSLRCAGDPDRVCPDSWVVRADVESRGRWTRPGSHGRHRRSPGRRPRFRQSQLDRLGALRVWNGVLRSDPTRALGVLREGLVYAKEHRMPVWEANIAFLAAGLGSGTRQSPARFGDV